MPRSIDELRQRLLFLLDLPTGWDEDHPDSQPIPIQGYTFCLDNIDLLASHDIRFYPVIEGGISLEWDTVEASMSLTIEKPNDENSLVMRYSKFFKGRTKESQFIENVLLSTENLEILLSL